MLENILLHKYLIAEEIIVHVVNKAVYTFRRVIKLKLTKWSETPTYICFREFMCLYNNALREIFPGRPPAEKGKLSAVYLLKKSNKFALVPITVEARALESARSKGITVFNLDVSKEMRYRWMTIA